VRIPKDNKDMLDSIPNWALVLKRRENGDYYDLKVMADPQRMLPFASYLERGEEPW
jgi:hypothetical protein